MTGKELYDLLVERGATDQEIYIYHRGDCSRLYEEDVSLKYYAEINLDCVCIEF